MLEPEETAHALMDKCSSARHPTSGRRLLTDQQGHVLDGRDQTLWALECSPAGGSDSSIVTDAALESDLLNPIRSTVSLSDQQRHVLDTEIVASGRLSALLHSH